MTLDDELTARGVRRRGHFRLSSGRHSDTYLQCALALQDPVFAGRLGADLARQLAPLRPAVVASPALGGVLAGFVTAAALGTPFIFTERKDGVMTLRRGQTVAPDARVVIVEDVLTTGGSAGEAAAVVSAAGGEVVGFGAIVDRSTAAQPLPFPAQALVRVEAAVWEEAACPLCAAGTPLDAPGSRPVSAP